MSATDKDHLPVHRDIVAALASGVRYDRLKVIVAQHGLPEVPTPSFPERVLAELPGNYDDLSDEYHVEGYWAFGLPHQDTAAPVTKTNTNPRAVAEALHLPATGEQLEVK